MIDYEVLCQTIEDWRAGRRPSIDFSAPVAAVYDELDSVEGYAEPDGYAAAEPAPYGDPAQSYEPAPYGDPAQSYEQGQYGGDPAQSYEQGQYGGDPAQSYGGASVSQDQGHYAAASGTHEAGHYGDPAQSYDQGQYGAPAPGYAGGEYASAEGYDATPPVPDAGYVDPDADESTHAYLPAYDEAVGSPAQEIAAGGTSPMELGDIDDDDSALAEDILVDDDDEDDDAPPA